MVSSFLTLLYKNRFLLLYVIFGVISLLLEEIVRGILKNYINILLSNIFSIAFSIFVAYFLNSKFNFKVPKKRFRRSIFYFIIISIFSLSLQFTFSELANISFINNRYFISAVLFLIAYFLHLNLSFKEKQDIGIAIHLNRRNDIEKIYKKVGTLPDFIHLDLIDESFNKENVSTDIDLIPKIKELWPKKKIQLHIMSSKPQYWFDKISTNLDEVYVHFEIGKKEIKKLNIENLGIVVNYKNQESEIIYTLENYKKIMILCIEVAGLSGQKYFEEIDKIIELVNKKNVNKDIKVVLDGGMTPSIASRHIVDEIVTASSVLENKYSKLQLSNFQTSKKYVQ